jgi:hypothetical protein
MKKVKLTGKLNLGKETVANLNNEQMGSVNGGGTIKGNTCCAGSWNHSSCGGHICGVSVNICPIETMDAACNPNG